MPLHGYMLTFRDTGKEFELKVDLLKMITNRNYNVDFASLSNKKLMYDFAKEINFDVKGLGRKSTGDRTLINLLKSQAIIASGVPNTMILPSDPDELCDRLSLLLQKKHAAKNLIILTKKFLLKV